MTLTRATRLRTPVVLGLLFAAATPGAAQTVSWRQDYSAARKEAADKGLPIVIDFITDNCLWCKKMDASTFRDTAVIAAMNEQYVPLKVNADSDPTLAQTLRISQYPTLVLAAPDGKILGVLEGYQEAAALADTLRKAASPYVPPEWMTREFTEATRAYSSGDYARAATLFKGVVQDGKERPIQVRAKAVLTDIEQQAASRLAKAKLLHDRGQSVEAAEGLADLLKAFAGTQAAADGSAMLTSLAARPDLQNHQRGRRARELLAQARDDYRTQQYLGCLERCELLTTTYADTPEATEALQLAAEVKDNPDHLARACDTLNLRMGAMYLTLAESWMKKGQPQQAQLCLERVQQVAPGTRQAELATVRLVKLSGVTTQQAEYKKPK